MLWSWKLRTPYNASKGLGLRQSSREGKTALLAQSLFRVHVLPALKEAGITARVGWHTLRHTFGTLVKANAKALIFKDLAHFDAVAI